VLFRYGANVDTVSDGARGADVVIAGGSYAGLAAALALGPRALVIDQHEIGAIQHSACAMPLTIAERFGVRDAVLQVYRDGYVHTAHGSTRFRLDPAYCLFDHQRLCRALFARAGARVLRARIQGLDGHTVLTSAGPIRGGLLIDASGWAGALATARRPDLVDTRRLTLGMEVEIPGQQDGIHFYFDPDLIPNGYAWLFPGGDTLRAGIGACDPHAKLRPGLERFLDRLGLAGKPTRGGRIPWFDRPPTVDDIFLAGDAAGQCVPLTAEGIRFALHFGELVGRIARQVLDGERTLPDGLATYRALVRRHRKRTALMRFAQGFVGVLPNRAIHLIAELLATPAVEPHFMGRYARWSEPVALPPPTLPCGADLA